MKYTNNYSYNVCWKGINVFPGQTVELKKKKKEVIKNGKMD